MTPIAIFGDGNCFYRALSMALFGHEERHLELRLRIVCELVMNIRSYLTQDTYTKMSSTPTDIKYVTESSISDNCFVAQNPEKSMQNEIIKSIQSGEYSSILHFFAAVNAINRPIRCIYPRIQNVAVNRHVCNQLILPKHTPTATASNVPIYIMWTHTENHDPVNWTPNHFVVCFDNEIIHPYLSEPPKKKFKHASADKTDDESKDAKTVPERETMPETETMPEKETVPEKETLTKEMGSVHCDLKTYQTLQKSKVGETKDKTPANSNMGENSEQNLPNPNLKENKHQAILNFFNKKVPETKYSNLKEPITKESQDQNFPKSNTTCETSSEQTDSPYDIGNIVTGNKSLSSMSVADKINFINNQPKPDSLSGLKPQIKQGKGKDTKGKSLNFQPGWIKQHRWLTYSTLMGGGLCTVCVLFPQSDLQHQHTFVTRPFTAYKKALGKDSYLRKHEESVYHKNAKNEYQRSKATLEDPTLSLPYKINKQNQTIYDRNVKLLSSIVETIVLCGKQNIPLRGHRDDATSESSNKGNFLAILQRIADHDNDLKYHLETAKRNATYTSKNIQNEIIQVVASYLRDNIKQSLDGGFYTVIADEVTDTSSNREVLAVCLRFLDRTTRPATIKEEFFDFVNLTRTTGESIANSIVETLEANGISIDAMRGQAYDGAAAMAGEKQGCQAKIKSLNKKALYTHCRSHILNLSIASACKLQQVRNMVDVLNSVFLFFDNSPKRQRFLEHVLESEESEYSKKKLVGLCKTRWIERHTCFDTFLHLYAYVVECLQRILTPAAEEDWAWDRNTKITAQGLLTSLTNFGHLITFVLVRHVLDLVKPLTVKLQKRDVDVSKAIGLIDHHIARVLEARKEIEVEFKVCYEKATKLASELDIDIKIPRTCSKQQNRANIATTNVEEYFRSVVAIPFLDQFCSELKMRFQEEDIKAYKICMLLPSTLSALSEDEIATLASEMMFYETDLDCLSQHDLSREFHELKRHYKDLSRAMSDELDDLLSLYNYIDEDMFPKTKTLLHIGCVLPVSTCEAERSFSGLRRIKTFLCNSMQEERLSGLALMHLHHSLDINVAEIVQRLSSRGTGDSFSQVSSYSLHKSIKSA